MTVGLNGTYILIKYVNIYKALKHPGIYLRYYFTTDAVNMKLWNTNKIQIFVPFALINDRSDVKYINE